MRRFVILLGLGALLSACGGGASASAPVDSWHAETLRPGVALARTPGEVALLERIASLPADVPVRLGEQVFVPGETYDAASGRRCRSVAERLVPPAAPNEPPTGELERSASLAPEGEHAPASGQSELHPPTSAALSRSRLVCADAEGRWMFVPDPFPHGGNR